MPVSPKEFYLVDPSGAAASIRSLLVNPAKLVSWHKSSTSTEPDLTNQPEPDRPSLPISEDGILKPGVLYPSSTETNVRYYIPNYVLRKDRGRFATSLKWRSQDESVDGPLAWLKIEFLPESPQHRRFELKEIEHEATVRLGYRISIQDSESSENPAIPQPPTARPTSTFDGEWHNTDPNTRGMTRLIITPDPNNNRVFTFQGFGKCHPNDCDWGVTPARPRGRRLIGTYDFEFKKTIINVHLSGDQLLARVTSDYAEGDRRSDRTDNYVLEKKAREQEQTDTHPTLWLELGAFEHIPDSSIRRVRKAIYSQEEFDRLLQIMTDESFQAFLEVRCAATIGHRTWRQIVTKPTLPKAGPVDPDVRLHRTRRVRARPTAIDSRSSLHTRVARPVRGSISSVSTIRPMMHRSVMARHMPRVSSISPSAATIRPSVALTPAALHREAPLVVRRIDHGDIKVAPARVLIDKRGEPAVVSIDAECRQRINTFWFSIPEHEYMFDMPQTPAAHHILLRHDITVDGTTVTLFQDSAFRNQIYYEPQEFRLWRKPQKPFAPDFLVAFYDTVDEAGEFHYRVRLTYRAKPYLDSRVLMQARANYGPDSHFTALEPVQSSLKLRVPVEEAGGDFQTVDREDSEILIDDGIFDSLDLSASEFQRIFAAFQGPDGIGLEGTVFSTLFDGSEVDIKLSLSLSHASGRIFDQTFTGPVSDQPDGRYGVTLRNRIESPVTINELHSIMLDSNAVAHPIDNTLPRTIGPGESISIEYQVTPDSTPVVDIEPALSSTIDTDHNQLWPLVMINEGYAPETFPLKLKLDVARYLDQPPPSGMQPLTGVEVRIEPDIVETLTRDEPQVEVTLRKPLLPWLMQQPELSKHFSYQIVNLHQDGPGKESEMIDGDGSLPLEVTPVP